MRLESARTGPRGGLAARGSRDVCIDSLLHDTISRPRAQVTGVTWTTRAAVICTCVFPPTSILNGTLDPVGGVVTCRVIKNSRSSLISMLIWTVGPAIKRPLCNVQRTLRVHVLRSTFHLCPLPPQP